MSLRPDVTCPQNSKRCIGMQCAWWQWHEQECCMKYIAKALEKILEYLKPKEEDEQT